MPSSSLSESDKQPAARDLASGPAAGGTWDEPMPPLPEGEGGIIVLDTEDGECWRIWANAVLEVAGTLGTHEGVARAVMIAQGALAGGNPLLRIGVGEGRSGLLEVPLALLPATPRALARRWSGLVVDVAAGGGDTALAVRSAREGYVWWPTRSEMIPLSHVAGRSEVLTAAIRHLGGFGVLGRQRQVALLRSTRHTVRLVALRAARGSVAVLRSEAGAEGLDRGGEPAEGSDAAEGPGRAGARGVRRREGDG